MINNLLNSEIENEKVAWFLSKIPEELKKKCKLKTVDKDKMVVLKGSEIEYIYIGCQGRMQVKNEFENGFIFSFASVNPIAYIGVMELMADQKYYSSTLQTTTHCTILEMPKEDFMNWITGDSQLLLEILRFVSSSMYEQSLKTGEGLAYPSLSILIGYLMNVFEGEEQESVFLQRTREEIGSALGFSVRTINRNLKVLKEEGLVTVSRKGIFITAKQYRALSRKLEEYK